jgi:osmoprotectant transport system substrate-binding protein
MTKGITMKRTALMTSLAAAAVLGLAGCGSGDDDPLASDGGDSSASGTSGPVVIGSANFPENALLAEIYSGALEGAGVETETKLNIGSREVYLLALEPGDESVDIFPEYTGVLRDYFDEDKSATGSASDEVYDELVERLPDYLTVLEPSTAEDKDAVVVTQETAEEYSLTEIGDLAEVAGDLTLGGPPEWKTRDTGIPGLEEVYGVTFADFKALDAGGPLTLNALLDGQVDAGNLFTTDPNIAAEGLVVLEDPDALFAAQNVVPLVRSEVLTDDIETTLNEVSAALDTDLLGELVTRVVIDKEDPEDVAADFLTEAGLD